MAPKQMRLGIFQDSHGKLDCLQTILPNLSFTVWHIEASLEKTIAFFNFLRFVGRAIWFLAEELHDSRAALYLLSIDFNPWYCLDPALRPLLAYLLFDWELRCDLSIEAFQHSYLAKEKLRVCLRPSHPVISSSSVSWPTPPVTFWFTLASLPIRLRDPLDWRHAEKRMKILYCAPASGHSHYFYRCLNIHAWVYSFFVHLHVALKCLRLRCLIAILILSSMTWNFCCLRGLW